MPKQAGSTMSREICQYDVCLKTNYLQADVLPYPIQLAFDDYAKLSVDEIKNKYIPRTLLSWNDEEGMPKQFIPLQNDVISLTRSINGGNIPSRRQDIYIRIPVPEGKPDEVYEMRLELEREPVSEDVTERTDLYLAGGLSAADGDKSIKVIKRVNVCWVLLNQSDENAHKIVDVVLCEKTRGSKDPYEPVSGSRLSSTRIYLSNTPAEADSGVPKGVRVMEWISSRTEEYDTKMEELKKMGVNLNLAAADLNKKTTSIGLSLFNEGRNEGMIESEHKSAVRLAAFLAGKGASFDEVVETLTETFPHLACEEIVEITNRSLDC